MIKNLIAENSGIISFIIFLLLNLIFTQRIYQSKRIIFYGALSFFLAFIASHYFRNENHSFRSTLIMNLLTFFYFLNIFLIKIFYKRINNFLIRKKIVNVKYLNKDFTHVSWDGDLPGSSDGWDENRALPPSGLDKILSICIIIFPIIVTIPFYRE